jgi:hypothetical protein
VQHEVGPEEFGLLIIDQIVGLPTLGRTLGEIDIGRLQLRER